MTATPTGPGPGDSGYIRGAGGVAIDGRKVVLVVVALTTLILAGVTAGLGVSTADQRSRQARLQREGVPVSVTVTSCTAVGSGIAQLITYYDCRGNYQLGGQTYNEGIRGSTTNRPTGQVIQAVADRDDPSDLSIRRIETNRASYLSSLVVGALTVLVGAAGFWWWRRGRGGGARMNP
jgi:hypothetical protein